MSMCDFTQIYPTLQPHMHARAQEKLLSDTTSRWELLAMLGLFGSCVSGTQALILERSAWQQAIAWGPSAGVAFAAFALALYTFYVLVPDVLVLGSSTILNLSLLTSDLWAAVARLVMFGGEGRMRSLLPGRSYRDSAAHVSEQRALGGRGTCWAVGVWHQPDCRLCSQVLEHYVPSALTLLQHAAVEVLAALRDSHVACCSSLVGMAGGPLCLAGALWTVILPTWCL